MKLYGTAELAKAIGVAPSLVAQWHRRGKLPKPAAELKCGPIWTGAAIERWIQERSGYRHV